MERLNASNRVAGIKQTRAAVESGRAQVVYIACDADPNAVCALKLLCLENGVELIGTFTRKELARACRIDVPCAACACIAEDNLR